MNSNYSENDKKKRTPYIDKFELEDAWLYKLYKKIFGIK